MDYEEHSTGRRGPLPPPTILYEDVDILLGTNGLLIIDTELVMSWRTHLDAVGQKTLPPDVKVMGAIGLSHSMTTALADLVDNSIDAGCSTVKIRFVATRGVLKSLIVVDDGIGMSDRDIDRAMTVGKRRNYKPGDLGHFGMGLKAASFSQADTLTVLSKKQRGAALGRRLRRNASQFSCDVIDSEQVTEALTDGPTNLLGSHGTVVRWDGVRELPVTSDERIVNDYVTRVTQQIKFHLSTTLHRLISSRKLDVKIDLVDAETGAVGAPQSVEAIDPFGYRRSGAQSYPKTLWSTVDGRRFALQCHVWPARSEALGFRLGGSAESRQGFYFYRNDRLLEIGGWKGAAVASRRLQLARVSVDISDFMDLFTVNMEKSAVQPKPALMRSIESAIADDGTTFTDYLRSAEESYQLGNVNRQRRSEVVPPGAGISPDVKQAIVSELPILVGRNGLDVRWKAFESNNFFEVDRPYSTLWLNSRYRSAVVSGRGSLNDAPLVKALLYLLTEDVFRGAQFGPRDRDNVELWQAILTTAAEAESDR